MGARTLAAKTTAAAILAVVLSLAAADPAAADELELSPDGTGYAAALPAPLFDSLARLVPLDSRSATFWVRNASSVDSYLRISVSGSTWSDPAYAAALTLQGGVPSATGSPVSVSSTAACRVLLYGVRLDPGEEVEVTVALALGDLDGSTGQAADVGITLGVTLTEAPGGADNGCSGATPVPVVAPRGPAGAAPAATPTAQPTEQPTTPDDPPPFEPIAELLANTLGSFNSGLIGWAAGAVLAGALAYLLTGALRARFGSAGAESPTTTQKDAP